MVKGMKLSRVVCSGLLALLILIGMLPTFAAPTLPTDGIFDNNVATSGKNGARSVIYISAEEMELTPTDSFKGVFLAVGSGVYTSHDGKVWTLRATQNVGLQTAPSNSTGGAVTAVRQSVAYGGQSGDKKALMTSGFFSAQLGYTDQDLNYISNNLRAVTEDGTGLYLTCILWDSYTQKFWAGANTVNIDASGSTKPITGAGHIYYSDGTIAEDEAGNKQITWKQADLGKADLFADIETQTSWSGTYDGVQTAKFGYGYISTDHKGNFVFGPYYTAKMATVLNGIQMNVGYISTDAAGTVTKSKSVSMPDGSIVKGDSADYEVGVTDGNKNWTPRHAVIAPNGEIVVAFNRMKSGGGIWYRMISCDISGETTAFSWVTGAATGNNAAMMGIIAQNQNGIAALSGWELTREDPVPEQVGTEKVPGSRSSAATTITWAPWYTGSGKYVRRRMLDDLEKERMIYGQYADGLDIFNTSAALAPDNTMVITQLVRAETETAGTYAYYGRLVTLTPTTDGTWAASAVTEEDAEVNGGVITTSGTSKILSPGKSSQLTVNSKNLITKQTVKLAPEHLWVETLEADEGLSVSENGVVSVNPDAVLYGGLTAKLVIHDKRRPSVFDLVTVKVTDAYDVSINGDPGITLKQGENRIRAEYLVTPPEELTEAFICVAIYHDDILCWVDQQNVTKKQNGKLPALETSYSMPEDADPSEYSLRVFFWDGLENMKPL